MMADPMSPELTALTLAALLQVVQFVLMSVPANAELGPAKTASPRDRARLGGSLEDQLSPKTARRYRALNNHFEGLILFGACAYAYLIARILYIPAYYFGWAPWRSLIWFVGFTATTLILLAALF